VGGAVGGSGAPNFLQDGALCTTSSECSSKNCGGRCCAVGKPCSCPQPSAKNLLKNPGFDSNVSGWTVTGNGTFHWVSVRGDDQDATSCPYSGFGRFYSNGVLTVSQCVAVSSANSYNLSTAVSNGSFGDFPNAGFGHMDCSLDWFTGPECTGSMPVVADGALKSQWLNGSWSPTDVLGDGPWFPPSGVVSARLSCTDTCDGDEPCYANIDKMGIVEAPATY
jgi:hypothetical protein